jgi:hypothetical protein
VSPVYLFTELDEDGNPIPVLRYSSVIPGLGDPVADAGDPLAAAENRVYLARLTDDVEEWDE